MLLLLSLVACTGRAPEDPDDWFDPGEVYDVTEPVTFTDEPYGLPEGGDPGIAELLGPALTFARGFGTRIAASDLTDDAAACSGWEYDDSLPVEVTGVVTILPKYYFKSNGCGNDDEKFYGSYFIEDDTGGMFVLADSRVAKFDQGDIVTIGVRGTRRSFGQDMVYVHDVLDVQRVGVPVRYVVKQAPFGDPDINEVRRVTGTVVTDPDTFGEFRVDPDDNPSTCNPGTGIGCAVVGLDIELNRRGITFAVGERVTFTGPILYSYNTYKLIVMRLGQIERL